MEVASLTFTVAQTMLAALDCSDLRELFSRFKCEPELEKLKKTVLAIEAVLQDADAKVVLNKQEQGLVDGLKNALYDADDLLDEFATVAAQEKQRFLTDEKGLRKVSKEVRWLFSRFEKLSVAYGMSGEVKRIRETLDGIASDATKFCFKVDNQPIRQRKEETCSYVYQPGIIGRDEDRERVIDMLLGPNVEEDIPVLTIVGMGGLGKTALSQLVFNDPRIVAAFSTLRLWVCVNDEGQEHLDVHSIISSILKSATNENHIGGLDRDQIQRKLRENLDGKRYLLFLDDVWTEERGEWLKLVEFLKGGHSGSRIVVTTRSKGTATAVGSHGKLAYELKGLSDENSWLLFEVAVGLELGNHPDLVAIGRAIVKKCANVPLAIKAIGSLLYGQDENKWRSFEANRLSEIKKGKNDIMQILKFSYHHLTPSLKSCFSYCALFPKDYIIEKEKLISLWLAQGYIEPLDSGQSIEDAAKEYFVILLRRCFFQDVEKDEFGKIVSCKIHDLMHDVALEVVRKEICASVVNFTTMSSLGESLRHVNSDLITCNKGFFTKTKIRTFLSHSDGRYWSDPKVQLPVDVLLANFTCLRALCLRYLEKFESVPDTIGKLLHLRYLDLSHNYALKVLPKSITKLHNLQTLLLQRCSNLRELPIDISKLVNLRVLDISDCDCLTYMPVAMEKLTHLCKLPMFIVAGRNSSSRQGVGEIKDLGPLKNLEGTLKIQIRSDYRYAKEKFGEGYLSNKKHLNSICIKWPNDGNYGGRVQERQVLLEDMQPHCNLRELTLKNYSGSRIPTWAPDDKLETSLPNLVKVKLIRCEGLQELPCLSKLRFLKSLTLEDLEVLEYIENNSTSRSTSTSYGAAATDRELSVFFPSLEELRLMQMPKLKGWWRGCGDRRLLDSESCSRNSQPVGVFPCLSTLTLRMCPNLISLPPCPMLEYLFLRDFSERLHIEIGGPSLPSDSSSSASSSLRDCGNQGYDDVKLRTLRVDNVAFLKAQPIGTFRCIADMSLVFDKEVESLSGGVLEAVFCACSSSLRSLRIEYCKKLRSVSGGGGGRGVGHLTALESLSLWSLDELLVEDEEDEMPWKSLGHNLRFLTLHRLPKMVKLPKGMHHLTSLHSLMIYECLELEELPEWIGCLSSLQSLAIRECRKMESLPDAMRNLTSLTKLDIYRCPPIIKERCRSPDGEDWPKIQHISHIQMAIVGDHCRVKKSSLSKSRRQPSSTVYTGVKETIESQQKQLTAHQQVRQSLSWFVFQTIGVNYV